MRLVSKYYQGVDRMSNENKNTAKSQRYRSKRKTKRYPLDFYLDNERQSKIYDWLKSQENGKETVLQALEQVMGIKN